MEQAKPGDIVKVHYTGKLEDGTVFDSSTENKPLEFKIGAGEIIPGFEEAIVGMRPGESKTQKVTADQAYGLHDDEMVYIVGRNRIPNNLDLEVGQTLEIQHASGRTTGLSVTALSESAVTLDANHPLAGKDLIFEIQLIAIA